MVVSLRKHKSKIYLIQENLKRKKRKWLKGVLPCFFRTLFIKIKWKRNWIRVEPLIEKESMIWLAQRQQEKGWKLKIRTEVVPN